jgi:hypothetical protein
MCPYPVASLYRLLLLITLFICSSSEFTNDFRAFIHNRYGLEIVNQLERRDLGEDASLGGKNPQEEEHATSADPHRQRKEPVLIIHGITNKVSRFNVSHQR